MATVAIAAIVLADAQRRWPAPWLGPVAMTLALGLAVALSWAAMSMLPVLEAARTLRWQAKATSGLVLFVPGETFRRMVWQGAWTEEHGRRTAEAMSAVGLVLRPIVRDFDQALMPESDRSAGSLDRWSVDRSGRVTASGWCYVPLVVASATWSS